MATVSLYLDTRYKRSDDLYLVKIKVSLPGHRNIQINTTIRISPNYWDKKKGRVVNHPNRLGYNNTINFKVTQVDKAVLDLEQTGDLYRLSPAEIKRRIENRLGRVTSTNNSFLDFFKRFIDSKEKPGTKGLYEATLFRIMRFSNGLPLRFEDITFVWLSNFQRYMSDNGLSINSQSIELRNIRAVFNQAINEDVAELNAYPFRKFKIKTEATRKRSLTIEQLRRLRDFECEESQRQYRDMFMLIFYLAGINTVDLFNLKKITNGYIEYRRAKTGRLYEIKVEPEAMEIIERYKGKTYLLNILDRYKDYRNYLHRLNKNLKEIGTVEIVPDKVGKMRKKVKTGLFPELSTYWARHTFATIAAGLDIPKETIAATLGHGGNDVTDIYIKFDQKKIDKCIRQVIDAVNGSVFK